MENNYRTTETVINIREIIWDLLSQWKAILIVSLIAMLLVGGLKYAKDLNSYDAAEVKAAAEQAAPKTVEQKVEEVLSGLPADERATVEYLSMQGDWTEAQKEYIANSILMNTNPANQRTLMLDYLISTTDSNSTNTSALLSGYARALTSDNAIASIGKAIDPNAEGRYITELIRTNVDSNFSSNTKQTVIIDADDNGAVLSVYIALPEDVDAQAVTDAVTSALKDQTKDFVSSIGQHGIKLIQSGEGYLYNADAVLNRNNILQSIYNQTNNAKNTQTSLTDGQKDALESIRMIKKEATSSTTDVDASSVAGVPAKPSFSKKYALLGFVLGLFGYAFVYLLHVIMKGRVSSASDSAYYTQARLLGEVYGKTEVRGLSKLLRSRFFEMLRYKGKTEENKQISKAIDAIDAVCEREDTKTVKLIDLTGNTKDQIAAIVKGAAEKGAALDVIDAAAGLDEKNLLDMDDTALVTGPAAKATELIDLLSLCKDYDINILGSIYIDPEAIS